MTTVVSKRSKASHVSSILKTTSIQQQLATAKKTPTKVRFQLPYSKKVKQILQSYLSKQQVRDYEDLVVLIRDAELFDDDLKTLLDEASECISLLSYELRLFVEAILSISWSNRGAGVVAQYQNFVQHLLCAHNYHTKYAIDKLVQIFIAGNEAEPWQEGNPSEKESESFMNVHWLLNVLLEVVPMCRDILINSLTSNFPYVNKLPHVHEAYVYNLLCILEYHPIIRPEILRLLFSKLVVLDVNAPKEEIEKAEKEWREEMFELDAAEVARNGMKNPVAQALDCCLDKVFNYFIMEALDLESGEMVWDKAKGVYQDMLNVFDQIILPTHNTHHVQFTMFLICSLKGTLAEAFLNYLWRKVTAPDIAPVLRMAATSYTSSLIARGSFIPIPMLKGTLQQMADWIHGYVANQDGNEFVNCDIRIHGVFYSVCQSLFYAIAFRQKDLVNTKKNIVFLESLNLAKIVTCKLNPLRACQSAIVQNFAAVTRKYQLAYCYAIIENNARQVMPVIYQDEKGSFVQMSTVLETFFPFDPYLLQRSGQKVWPFYLDYAKCEAETKDAGERISNDAPADLEDDDFLAMETSQAEHEKFSYGTSPGFKCRI